MSYECVQNIFYSFSPYTNRESILAISPDDYSFTYQSWNGKSEADPGEILVFSSSVWSDPQGAEFLLQAAEMPSTVRVQISMGAEFFNHEEKLKIFLENGGACDILVDRPISAAFAEVLKSYVSKYDLRICYIVNKYFDISHSMASIPVELMGQLVLIFLPPLDKRSSYYTSDEAFKIINSLDKKDSWRLVTFRNIVEHLSDFRERSFFSSLSAEAYYRKPDQKQTYALFRKTVVWLARKNWILFLDIIYSLLVFLRDPKNYLQFRTWAGIKHFFYMTYVVAWHRTLKPLPQRLWYLSQRTAHFLRYKIAFPVVHTMRYRIFNRGYSHLIYKVIPNTKALCHSLAIFARYKLYNFVKYRLLHASYIFIRYRVFQTISDFLRYQAIKYLLVLFYPFRKIYWFLTYQYENRFLPLVERLRKES